METKTIKAIRRDRAGFQDTDEQWWSCKFNPLDPSIERGDTVSFKIKAGTTFVQGKVTKTAGAPAAASGGGGSTGGGFTDRDTSIIRQNVLRHATQIVCNREDDVTGDLDTTVATVIGIAEQLESYVRGDFYKELTEEMTSMDELDSGLDSPKFG